MLINNVTPARGAFTVTLIDASVTVEAGTFICYEYSSSPRIYYMDYAPDVGLTKFIEFGGRFYRVLIRQHTLVDYHIE